MSKILNQQRAHSALQFVKAFSSVSDEIPDCSYLGSLPEVNRKFRKKLHTHIQKAPIQILQNGLGQMLAFLLADNGGKQNTQREPSAILYGYLADWVCGGVNEGHPCRIYAEEINLIEQLMSGSRQDYIRAQRELLSLFDWLKKFADAWLDEGEN